MKSLEHTAALSALLRGIEDVGDRHAHVEANEQIAEGAIASHNAALLFAGGWRGGGGSCKVSGERGGVRVVLQNGEVALGVGWGIRVVVNEGPDPALGSVVEVGIKPVGRVESGGQRVFYFPLKVSSHAPRAVCVSLAFQGEDEDGDEGAVWFELALCKDIVLDVLHFSVQADEEAGVDAGMSVSMLRGVRLLQCLDPARSKRLRPLPVSTRFEVPVAAPVLRKLVGIGEGAARRVTYLGEEYTICMDPALSRGAGADEELEDGLQASPVTSVTVRAVPHLLPFVRSAVLRRVLTAKEEGKVKLRPVEARSGRELAARERRRIDAIDECLPAIRRAETQFVEAKALCAELEDYGRIELCADSRDKDVMLAAVRAVSVAYAEWRRRMEDVWTPDGGAVFPEERKKS